MHDRPTRRGPPSSCAPGPSGICSSMGPNNASALADSLMQRYSAGGIVRAHILTVFAAIAWYNAIELIILCFVSFKRRRGCYFWSLLVSSVSLFPQVLGFVLLFFTNVNPSICVSLIIFSWYGMVTGQSMVLWSRLHLVLQNTKVLRGVLWMIVVDGILFHIPPTVLFYGRVSAPSVFDRPYNIMERVQLVGFCVQEMVISGIYVWETIKLLRLRPRGRPHGILRQLLAINIAILVLDVSVVVIEYVGFYAIQVMFKPVVYSVKLKLEYAILGKLVTIARGPNNCEDLLSGNSGINSIGPSQSPPMYVRYQGNIHRQCCSSFGEDVHTTRTTRTVCSRHLDFNETSLS